VPEEATVPFGAKWKIHRADDRVARPGSSVPLKNHVRNLWLYILPFLKDEDGAIKDKHSDLVARFKKIPNKARDGAFATPQEVYWYILGIIREAQKREGLLKETEVPYHHLEHMEG
jgi:hypothetical protein